MIVFDLDDTLYLERDFAFSGYAALDTHIEETTGRSGFGALCRSAFEAGRHQQAFNEALTALDLPADPERIGELVARYRGHVPKIVLCGDARRCLDRLAARLPLGLITDGPEATQRAKIAALGIASSFAVLRPTGAWGTEFSKPHPRAFLEMEAAAGGAPLVYVADNALKDFVTPRARGWYAIQICRNGRVHTAPPPDEAHSPHAQIETLDALERTLQMLGWTPPAVD
ncbi:HAD family hydrolase [Rhodophyticola porphyridii]|uniref:HAD family hydrolase n=1 Tax=Rhodophyticola porphyridii TaxID=1852017 RepID=A0A3L9XYF9_9RHOB|nr:HAD family hydrolase [Rhodophyticola porphyridii]RMA41554.1 HAD family hydrolase [Rhodophyticola porphyridii]